MFPLIRKIIEIILIPAMTALLMTGTAHADGWNPDSRASNMGSIVNTRHNMTQSFLVNNPPIPGWGPQWMDGHRINFLEVCVYCHTPHGANTTIAAPLWNRTNKNNTYTLYNIPLTSGQSPTNPGVNSLVCLSCHDGSTAIDSVINMPGSGKYSAAQQTSQNNAFLNTWNGQTGNNHTQLYDWNVDSYTYYSGGYYSDGVTPIDPSIVSPVMSCLNCHSVNGFLTNYPRLHFDAFALGTDLTNDHPIGVQLPDTNIYDFKAPTGTSGALKFFDTNANGKPDKSEVRFYNTGGGYEVECASCHDPHGVPSAGPGSVFIPSFLRVSNAGSVLCMTCHDK